MASITFIEYNSKGFWIPPSFVELLSDYICTTFENIGVSTFSQNLQKIHRICDSNRKGENIGMVDILLDGTVNNDTDKTTLIGLLNQTKCLILSHGPELNEDTLRAFENRKTADYFKEPWAFPVKTHSLTATVDIIIQMLDGTWTSENYSVYYTGFPNPMNMTEI